MKKQVNEEAIVTGCLEENKFRITQSNYTTLRVSPMQESLGDLGTGKVVDSILEGIFTRTEGADDSVQVIMDNLKEVDKWNLRSIRHLSLVRDTRMGGKILKNVYHPILQDCT